MAKKLSKILWYGAEKDDLGKPVIPPLSPSVEKHLEGLNEGEIYIHNDDEYPALYIRTNKDKIVAIGGAEALMKYFLRKDQPDTAREVITFEKGLSVGEFVSGVSGASFFKDLATGQTIMELDKLYVRMKAFFETLTIVEAQTISGKQIISPAGSVRCTNVEEYDEYYRCYFLNEQDGEKIENKFIVGDQVYSQMFNAKTGTSNKISNRYYWRLVTGVGENYIDLSKTDCDADSDAPMVGDVLNQRGHRYPENSERMNFIETSTVDGFSPSITLFHGVNSFSLAGKDYVQFGVDKTTNKAFMNVYGDMYVGDRNKTAYMRYTQEEGLVICGKLDVGTKLGDSYLKDLISASTPEGYQEFVEKVTQDLEGLQAQIDGTIDSYFFQYEPSLDNYPASEWDTEDEKKAHLNDTFTNLVDGRSWRWSLDGTYKWVEITDTATTKALALAGKAQDTADGKRRVFVDTPYPPYDKGDLWSRGSDYPLMICVVPKESGVYADGDFDYADNNAKLKQEMQTLVSNTKSELNNSIGQAKESANKYTDECIESAKEDINASIDELEKAKANVTEVYSKAEADGKITEAETSAINAAKAQADAAIALSETTIKAYADGIVDDEEAARIKQAQENLAEAKEYAEEQAKAAKSEIENSYLFQALQDAQSTEIENGLVLTSLIQLRDTQSNIMSGINGLINASKGDKSIATWWGGGMYDLIDYYRWDGTQWVVKSGMTAPSNIPSGLIRMDGTGYLAKGKFWWDNDGKIYADPTALFLSFDVNAEEGTLSATILDIRDKQTEFANMWSLETDSNGTQYLYSKYPLVSQGGVTMYAGTSGLDVEGIYDGLPIDGSTIYWENGILKAVGGGGVADSVAWADITGKPSFSTVATSGSYNDLLNKPTLLSSFTNDLGFVTESALSGKYLPITGGTINSTSTSDILRLKTTIDDNPRILILGSSGNVLTALGKWDDYTYLTNFKSGTQCWELRLFDNNTIQFGYGATNYPILHSNNYTSYTYSQSTIDSKLSGYQPLITSTNKLAYSLISGTPTIPTSLKSPYALTFGSKTYDGSAAKTITASDLGALTAHQTIYNLTMQAGAFSAVTFDPNGSAKTVNIPTTTSHISEGTNLYFTNARAVSALSSTLSGYLPLTGGTLSGDLGLAYNSSNNSSKGIRFQKDGSSHLYLYRNESDLYFDGGGAHYKVLRSDNYSSYALPLTGGTLTAGSGVYAPLIVKNSKSEVWIQFQDSVGSAFIGTNKGVPSIYLGSGSNMPILHSGNIGSYNAGGIIGALWSAKTTPNLLTTWHDWDNEAEIGYSPYSYGIYSISKDVNYQFLLGAAAIKDGLFFKRRTSDGWGDWKTIAFTDSDITGNAATATRSRYIETLSGDNATWYGDSYRLFGQWGSDNGSICDWKVTNYEVRVDIAKKLNTARTIWGQSFDGSGNVSGDLNGVGRIIRTEPTAVDMDWEGNFIFKNLSSVASNYWHIDTSDRTPIFVVHNNGNVGIGTTNDYGYKLGVTGSVYITSNLLTGGGVTMYSQRSLKNVIDEDGLSLRELSVIKPTRYTWKDKRDERLHIGGIADDIQQVLPEVVYRTPDGVLTMDYGNAAFAIASSLIKPMIEHESEIVSLKRRVRELEEEVKRLRA